MSGASLTTKRLFIGLSFEESLKRQIQDVVKKLKVNADKKDLQVKWTPEENIHLTIKFLGETDVDGIEALKSKLHKLAKSLSPIQLKIRGMGGFPEETQARILWLGVQNKSTLRGLQSIVENTMIDMGFEAADQNFIPHITIGRLRNKKNIVDLISPFVRNEFGKAKITKIRLFESQLQGSFPVYFVVDEFELQGTGTLDGEPD